MIQTLTELTPEAEQAIAEEKKVRQTDELFVLFSLGSQFDHLIKQALDKLGVFCIVADPGTVTKEEIEKLRPTGIVVSGGPSSVVVEGPQIDSGIFDIGIPTLGVCLGFQEWAHHIGAQVAASTQKEFGTHLMAVGENEAKLFAGLPDPVSVLESHGDRIEVDDKLTIIGTTEHAPVAAARHGHLWGVQFHPEASEGDVGEIIFCNFCFKICGAKDRFPATDVAKHKINQLKGKIGSKNVLLALSGGSDSSVAAYLLKEALAPGQLRGIYIKGIDRPDDEAHVIEHFGKTDWIEVNIVDATDRFLTALKGAESMADKRLAMRGVYKEVLETEAKEFGAEYIAQGTLYTDISESGTSYSKTAVKSQIKLHHNTGLGFFLDEITPLDDLVKDSARNVGRSVGVPESLLLRHPFPGPGLVVRIEGEVTAERLQIARKIDGIYIEELRKADIYNTVWQAGAVVTHSVTTATKGDSAASGLIIALWAVWSVNGFTARWAELPAEFLRGVSQRITNEVPEVGAVVYRISDKPPTTIEWG